MKKSFLRAGLPITVVLVAAHCVPVSGQKHQPEPQFRLTPLVTLHAQDRSAGPLPETAPQFLLSGFVPEARTFLVQVSDIGEPVDKGADSPRFVHDSHRSVNLDSGAVTTLAKVRGDLDWCLRSPGPLAASRGAAVPSTPGTVSPLTLGKPSPQPPLHDVLQRFTPGDLQGKAVYTVFTRVSGTGNNSVWRTFLVLRRFGHGAARNSVQTYPAEVNEYLFAPQWSPDGQTVRLKVGDTFDRYGTYRIYLWQPQSGVLRPGPTEDISYLLPRWSPGSRRIAYIKGGDIYGGCSANDTPPQLRVYDVNTRKSRLLVSAYLGAVNTPAEFAWTHTNTLLYTLPPQPTTTQPSDIPPSVRVSPNDLRPDIYQVSTDGGTPKLLIPLGIHPIPSPAGRWIAFFGWPQLTPQQAKASSHNQDYDGRLFLFDCRTGKRYLVRPNVPGFNTQLLWTPDGKRLVVMQTNYDEHKARGTAHLSTVPIP